MEISWTNLEENHEVMIDHLAEDDEDDEISHNPSALHILDLPDSVIFQILIYLPFSSIGAIAQVCSRFSRISSDELLWRHVFLQHYKLPTSTVMPAKARSWRQEFKRLYYHTPAVLSEERKEHKDEVLHVSFSHDGTMFATCSKDGFFKVWECTHPVRLLFKMDMKSTFSWKFTQFSQFNESDTCLLVSGVYFGRLSTSGEIAVFNLQDDFRMQCRVTNKPYDVFGAWYDNDHLLSGTLYWTGDFNSVSAVWLSKASQEVESEVESVSMVLYRFENVNSSSIRLLHVAEVDRDSDTSESVLDKEELDAGESVQTSPQSSSLSFGDDVKISMDVDSSISRSDCEDKVQDKAPAGNKLGLLDFLRQSYGTEDAFRLENGGNSEDHVDGLPFDLGASKGCETMDYIEDESERLPESLNAQQILTGTDRFNETVPGLNQARDVEEIDHGKGINDLLPLQKHMQAENSSSHHEDSEKWSCCKSGIYETNIEPDVTQVSATTTSDQVWDRPTQSTKSCECNPGFPEQYYKLPLPSARVNELNISQNIAKASNIYSPRSHPPSSFISNNISAHAESSNCRSRPLSTFPSDNPLDFSRTIMNNITKTATSHEFGSVSSGSISSLPTTSNSPSLDALINRTDIRIRTFSDIEYFGEGSAKRSNIFNISNVSADCTPGGAMDLGMEYGNVREPTLRDTPESFDAIDLTLVSSTSDNIFEGATLASSTFGTFEGAISPASTSGTFEGANLRGSTSGTFEGAISPASTSGTFDGANLCGSTSGTFEGSISPASTSGTFDGANLCGSTSGTFEGANLRGSTSGTFEGANLCGSTSGTFEGANLRGSTSGAFEGANFPGSASATFEGASSSSYITDLLEQTPNNHHTREQYGVGKIISENVSAASGIVFAPESEPYANDVSQRVNRGDAATVNVPSPPDSNLVMVMPNPNHANGNRDFISTAQNTNNSSTISYNVVGSSSIEGHSGTESDAVVDPLVRESRMSHSHKSSIATQTEIASSRASSFHSLSHISQSSSISRDLRCSPPREKLLIYTWGSETYIPHKVGIKRMKWTDFTKGEVTARRSSMLLPDVMENLHNMAGNRRDKPDVTIEMHGHIVGLSLSPDHKFLYVNCRPWPKNYIISDPQESPPLAQEVEVSTIDLTTFNFVGPVLRSHKAYTHSDECFFLNLDVSDDYVASGAEDRQGYLWDRHYGIPLYRFPHRNVVNCVAINPQDSEILVTVSDDYTFKVWMSRCRASELTGSQEASTGTSV